MKKIILSVALGLLINIAFAQTSEVISDSLSTKSQLFSKSIVWVAKTWKNANEVIQLKDETGGIIIVKGGLASTVKTWGDGTAGHTTTTITIQLKDGKAKIEFGDTKYSYSGMVGRSEFLFDEPSKKKTYVKWKTLVMDEETAMIESYKKSLLSSNDF